MNQQRGGRESAAERRRRQKEAARRLEAWEQLRAGAGTANQPAAAWGPLGGTVGPGTPAAAPGAPLDPGMSATDPPRFSRILSIISRAFVGVLVSVALTGATPVVSGQWDPAWLLVLLVVTGAVSWLVAGKGEPRFRAIGWAVAVIVLSVSAVGVLTQNVLNGEAVREGSQRDRSVETFKAIERSVEILTENQRLLFLSSEQAIGVASVYTDAAQQAVAIAERWNPVIAAQDTPENILALMAEVNAVAARQAAAFENFAVNLTNPEAAIEAKALTLRGEVEAMLQGSVADRMSMVRAELYGEKEERP